MTGWVEVDCLVADVLVRGASRDLFVSSSLSDPAGDVTGVPQIKTEWSLRRPDGVEVVVLCEERWPSRVEGERDVKPCKHLVPAPKERA